MDYEETKVAPDQPATADQDEHSRRVLAEVRRLAGQSAAERKLWAPRSAERLGMSAKELLGLIEAEAADRERARKADEERIRRQEAAAEKARKSEETAAKRATQERTRKLKALVPLPTTEREGRLARMSEASGEDVDALREELDLMRLDADVTPPPMLAEVELWPDPVDTAALLEETETLIGRFVVTKQDCKDAVMLGSSLWTGQAWVHQEIATHSPVLGITSPEEDSGKSTLADVLSYITPRPRRIVDPTAASFYRLSDGKHPTVILDENDAGFLRRPALANLVNASWTPDHPIPRTINGKQVFFQVFCPKIIVMRGRQMEPTTASRFIWCKVWAKLEDEDVEDFDGRDCEAFEQLRRKFTRWAADNAAALDTIKPTYPPRFNNRLQKNWRLLLAIAELAGGEWPQRARRAAVILTDRRAIEPSDGVRLLVSLDPLITRAISGGRKWLTSEEITQA